MAENQRQQLVVERILEDESLRGDLDDTAAQALLTWATGTAGTIAADTTLSDAEVDNKVQAVRRAALIAAGLGVSDPTLLVAQAAAALPTAAPDAVSASAPGTTEGTPILATAPVPNNPIAQSIPSPNAHSPTASHAVMDTSERAMRRQRTRFGALLKRLRRGT